MGDALRDSLDAEMGVSSWWVKGRSGLNVSCVYQRFGEGTYSLLRCLRAAAVADVWIYIVSRCFRAAGEVCRMGSMWNSLSKALAAAWL